MPLALAAVFLLVVPGCSMLEEDGTAQKAGTAQQGGPDEEPGGPPIRCSPDDCPDLVPVGQEIAASGIDEGNWESAVPEYFGHLLDDLDQAWGGWLRELNIPGGPAGRMLVHPGETFVSECETDDGERAEVTSDTANAFACPQDTEPDGQGHDRTGVVILPIESLSGIWEGNLLGVRLPGLGDFSAAAVVAHEYGHVVNYRLMDAYGLDRPPGDNPELLADCLAGNWLATVWGRDDLGVGRIWSVLTVMSVLGDPQPGMGHGTTLQRYEALGRGFGFGGDASVGAGQPVQCLAEYWPESLA